MRPVMMPCGVRCWNGVSVVSISHSTMPRLQRKDAHSAHLSAHHQGLSHCLLSCCVHLEECTTQKKNDRASSWSPRISGTEH